VVLSCFRIQDEIHAGISVIHSVHSSFVFQYFEIGEGEDMELDLGSFTEEEG
jgi:hypothetical protein